LGGTEGSNGVGAGAGTGKPRTQSLLDGMTLDTVTLEDALRLLSLPRVVGVDSDGEEIVATHGRYGPYLKKGADSRSLQNDDQLFTVTLEEARAMFAQPKPGRGSARSAAALRELGPDPVTGQPVVVKEGRFGPYVTDGITNASLRKGDSVDAVTLERAAELLADRREAAPRPTRAKKAAATTKKAPVKKASATKKSPATKKPSGVKKARKSS
jgi:DNA topoisomerase-1